MDRVKQFYQVTFLGKRKLLTPEEFAQLQKECKEIYEYGKLQLEPDFENREYWTDLADKIQRLEKPELIVPVPEANVEQEIIDNREFLVTKSPHKAIAEVVKTAAEPMNTNILADRVDPLPPSNAKKIKLEPYIKMHEAGKPIEAIKNQMLEDGFCPQTTLSYHIGNVLKASTRVTHIEAPIETDDECIERLKRENKDNLKKRQEPKVAVKI